MVLGKPKIKKFFEALKEKIHKMWQLSSKGELGHIGRASLNKVVNHK